MKTMMMRIQKSPRLPAMLLATFVAILTCVTVANATQTITTPNAVNITYSLASGANSAAITPATSKSVLVMGCCTTSGDEAVAHVSLLHIPSSFIQWVGSESNNVGSGSIISGKSGTAATLIVSIDFSHLVDIQVNSVDTIRIHNGTAATRAGSVTLIW